MVLHINSLCKTTSYHLRNIARIRHLLSKESTEILVHAFVVSKLDYCNALLYGLPQCVIKKLQLVQNSNARLITCSTKYDHTTPLLIQLHRLPITQRIWFKILLLTFKAIHKSSPVYLQVRLKWWRCCPVRRCFLSRIRAPVAHFVEHRALMREAVSSTPAGPTLRVLK